MSQYSGNGEIEQENGFDSYCKKITVTIPKVIGRINFFGVMMVSIYDNNYDFKMPTPEQRENLKNMLGIEVEMIEENNT